MSGLDHPNMEHHAYEQAPEFNHFILKQNWTSGILREEAALLDEFVTGRRTAPDFALDTETQREYRDPNAKKNERMKHIEENRLGRYAYTPNQTAPNGILPTFNAKAYPEVIPRFDLPKMPY